MHETTADPLNANQDATESMGSRPFFRCKCIHWEQQEAVSVTQVGFVPQRGLFPSHTTERWSYGSEGGKIAISHLLPPTFEFILRFLYTEKCMSLLIIK